MDLRDLAERRSRGLRVGRRKRRFEITMTIPRTPLPLPKNTGEGPTFEVYERSEKLGVLMVGQGSVIWRPARKHVRGPKERKFSWREFAERMES